VSAHGRPEALTASAQREDGPVIASPDGEAGPPTRHIRSFALRRGHFTQGQRRAFDALLPTYGVPYSLAPLDVAALFGRRAPTVLEIGFGMGETTAAIASQRPDVNFIGIEVFAAGVGALLKRIEAQQLANVRIVHHDAVEVLRDMIAPDSLAGVHVYFPDPWQKKRHHKRRLIAQPFVGRLASRVAPGGYLHCATDWEDYATQMLEVLSAEPQLANAHAAYAPSSVNPLAERPTTKFHARGTRLGHGVWDLVFLRRPAAG
jgi:tRNA (guanine-N7-)-methyltransferase